MNPSPSPSLALFVPCQLLGLGVSRREGARGAVGDMITIELLFLLITQRYEDC